MWPASAKVTRRPVSFASKANAELSDLLHSLQTTADGLSSRDAARRLQDFGPNDFEAVRLRWKIFEYIRASVNPLVVILLIAGVASAFLGEEANAVIIGAIVFLSSSLNAWQTVKSEGAMKRLKDQVAPTATARRDGSWVEIERRNIVIGDVIHLSAGDLVPADARLIETTDLHIQQAALTGESLPVEKFAVPKPFLQVGPDAPGLVFLGTSIVVGTAMAVVFAAGRDTAFGDVVERLASRPEETEFERGTHRFGMLILETVFFLVLFILIVNISMGRDAIQSLLFSVALAVGLTPEFLPMITTVTLAQGAVKMARDKVIVKHLSAIQNLGSIDVLCSDKTNTLTSGFMSLDASLDPVGQSSKRPLFLALLNSKFQSGIKSPLDAAIINGLTEDLKSFRKTDEIPFDFDRRRLSVVVEKDNEFLFVTKGAPEGIIEVCSHYEVGGEIRDLGKSAAQRCRESYNALCANGFRVLGVGYRLVRRPSGFTRNDESGLILAGFVTFADHILDGVDVTIKRLKADGVQIKILTGDNELVTQHMCMAAGLDTARIVLGSELVGLENGAFIRLVEEANVFSRVSPAQKHQIVKALKAAGHVVGYLGDGINDAPSLHGADVGISVAGAVDIAREASDIILLERGLEVIHAGIIVGRKSFGNVLKYLLMGTSSNFGNMFSMAGAAVFLPFLPMLPKQILLNNFLYDLAQLTIPTDNVDPIYVKAPRRWDISLIRRFMLVIGPVSSIYDFLTFYVLLRVFRFDETLFHTGWFLESLATQTLVLFVIRTIGRPWSNPPSRPLLVTTCLVVIVGGALPYLPVADLLGFAPLPVAYLGFLVIAIASYLVAVDWVKSRFMRHILNRAAAIAGPESSSKIAESHIIPP